MERNDEQTWTCETVRANMQEYLDETLVGADATRLFLHVRGCDPCRRELERMKDLFGALDALPAIEAPADFDERILASVPYAAYREMEPLRRQRVPVILEEESLPAFLRSGATRIAGLAVAAAAIAATSAGRLADAGAVLAAAGLLPEALVRLQQFGRRIYAGAVQEHRSS